MQMTDEWPILIKEHGNIKKIKRNQTQIEQIHFLRMN